MPGFTRSACDTSLSHWSRWGALLGWGAVWHAEPPAIDEHNPIGAGDALVAGLVWGLSHGHSSAEILCWGVACGAAAASLDGMAMGSRSLVENLAGQVCVVSVTDPSLVAYGL